MQELTSSVASQHPEKWKNAYSHQEQIGLAQDPNKGSEATDGYEMVPVRGIEPPTY